MLEMGIALIAACLPTLRPLLHEISFERMAHSIRIKLSPQSSRNRSWSDGTNEDAAKIFHNPKRAFAFKKATADQLSGGLGHLETHIMADKGSQSRNGQPYLNEINICNDLTQSVERV